MLGLTYSGVVRGWDAHIGSALGRAKTPPLGLTGTDEWNGYK